MMNLYREIENYRPFNGQEEADRKLMLQYLAEHEDCLERSNRIAHFTASIWTVNREWNKTLMVYHKLYQSWSWIGGHADGVEDLRAVALRELLEETGVAGTVLADGKIFSLEVLGVDGHMKKGSYVSSHLHLNVTYLAEADENQELAVNEEENQAVKWWTFEEALKASREPWFVENIYSKLIRKTEVLRKRQAS